MKLKIANLKAKIRLLISRLKNSKKLSMAAVILSIVLAGLIITALYLAFFNNHDGQDDSNKSKTACDVFSQETAKQVLGESANKVDLTAASGSVNRAQAANNNVVETNCLFEYKSDDPRIPDLISVSLTLKEAKNETGKTVIKQDFDLIKTSKASDIKQITEPIPEFGDAGYYNYSLNRANVLAKDNTYLITVVSPNREKAEKVAKSVIEKL